MDPKTDPLYIVPKILLLPFQPFKVIKDAVTEPAKPSPKAPEQGQSPSGGANSKTAQ